MIQTRTKQIQIQRYKSSEATRDTVRRIIHRVFFNQKSDQGTRDSEKYSNPKKNIGGKDQGCVRERRKGRGRSSRNQGAKNTSRKENERTNERTNESRIQRQTNTGKIPKPWARIVQRTRTTTYLRRPDERLEILKWSEEIETHLKLSAFHHPFRRPCLHHRRA